MRLQALPGCGGGRALRRAPHERLRLRRELVLRAERRGYRIAEIPVNWTDQPGSKVGVFTDGPRMLAQIVAARMRLSREGRKGRR